MTALPKLGEKITEENMGEVKDIIDKCLSNPEYAEGRNKVREECWQCYGEGAVKTVDYLVAKYEEINTKEK